LGLIVPLAAYEVPKHRVPGSTVEGESDLTPSTPDPLPPNPSEALYPPIECETYIWSSYPEELTKEPWSFHDFIRLNAWKWLPGETEGVEHQDYLEVDRRREMEGEIVREPVTA
jgi:hypothetical protein